MADAGSNAYVILETLHRSRQYIVYLAKNYFTGKKAVIKTIDPKNQDKYELKQVLSFEAETGMKLIHENIRASHSVFEEDNNLYYVCEYVEGTTLETLLSEQKGRLDYARGMELIRKVLSALDYAHSQGVLHLNLNPSNILISLTGEVKLSGFGKAQLGWLRQDLDPIGFHPVFYLAPEQYKGESMSPSCDVYSLGVIAYQVFSGFLPWNTNKTFSALEQKEQSFARPVLDPDMMGIRIPHWLFSVINASLMLDPSLRFQTPAEMLQAIEAETELRYQSVLTRPVVVPVDPLLSEPLIEPEPEEGEQNFVSAEEVTEPVPEDGEQNIVSAEDTAETSDVGASASATTMTPEPDPDPDPVPDPFPKYYRPIVPVPGDPVYVPPVETTEPEPYTGEQNFVSAEEIAEPEPYTEKQSFVPVDDHHEIESGTFAADTKVSNVGASASATTMTPKPEPKPQTESKPIPHPYPERPQLWNAPPRSYPYREDPAQESAEPEKWQSTRKLFTILFMISLSILFFIVLKHGLLKRDPKFKSVTEEKKNEKAVKEKTIDNVKLTMQKISGDTLSMGSIEPDADSDEFPLVRVVVPGFYISPTEITQRQWKMVFQDNPSKLQDDDLPVTNVSFYDAIDWCNEKSLKDGYNACYEYIENDVMCDFSANGYRLPTEAEWEFAAKTNGQERFTKYSGTNDPDEAGWYSLNSGAAVHPVGQKSANIYELYDLSGNVYEWTWNWYAPYSYKTPNLFSGPEIGTDKVIRGGSWFHAASEMRNTNRHYIKPFNANNFTGFRVVRTAQ